MISAQTTANGHFSREKKVDKNLDRFHLILANTKKRIRIKMTATNVIISETIASFEFINSSTKVATSHQLFNRVIIL